MPGLIAIAIAAAVMVAPRHSNGDRPPRALAVVVAKSSKVRSLTGAELKRAFSGDTVIIADQRLAPFSYPPGSAERVAFDRAVLDMSEAEVGRYWVDRKIRGNGQPPRSLPTPMHVTKLVGRFPGAIGYVPVDQLTDDVVPVAIDGLLPTARGYPIVVR